MVAALQPKPASIIRLAEWRCQCGALLGRIVLRGDSMVEVKCQRCGRVVVREGAH